jgi:hypothetical protein
MPTLASTHKQLYLAFPADLIDAAREGAAKKGETLTWSVEKHLNRLAGRPVPKTPRKRGRKINPDKSENT